MPVAAVPIIAAAISGGAGVASSVLANRKGANTASNQSSQRRTSTQTSRTRRNLTPEQQALLGNLFSRSQSLMTDPAAALDPIRQQRRNQVNQTYRGAEDLIRSKYDTGAGRSGKYGRAAVSTELSRLGALGGVDADISRLILEQQGRGESLAERLLSLPLEQESTSTVDEQGNLSGTQTGPSAGGLAGGLAGLGSNLSSLSALMALQRLLQGGGTPQPGMNDLNFAFDLGGAG